MDNAKALHDDAIVVDGHVHITNAVFYQGLDPWEEQATGGFDYARARRGGLNVVIENIFVDDAYNRYNYTVKQACRLLETFHRVLDRNPDKMALALNSHDIRRIVGEGKMAIILALEGGFDMEGDLDVLRLFHRLGVRSMQFTNHDTTNAMTDAAPGEKKWNGISEHGRTVIGEMNRLGIIIDISHCNETTQQQIIACSRAPVVHSHCGLRRFCDMPSNPTDDVLRTLSEKGGLVGLNSVAWHLRQESLDWGYYVRPHGMPGEPGPSFPPLERAATGDYGDYIANLDEQMRWQWESVYGYGEPWRDRQREALDHGAPCPTVEDWVELAAYVVDALGDRHIAIGLDLMAGGHFLRDFDAACYPRLTEAMVARGFSETTIRRILGENWLSVLDAVNATATV